MASKNKTSVLVFVDWFYPGYLAGGPVQSIVSLVENLHEDIDFWVVTSDRDLNAKESYPNIQRDTWVDSEKGCKVFYASPEKLGRRLIIELLKNTLCKTVYINGLFSKQFSIIPLLVIKSRYNYLKVIVAPRGMLGKGALTIKRYKKAIFLYFSKLTGLYKNVLWHATSYMECNEIKKVMGNSIVTTISNLSMRISAKVGTKKEPGSLQMYFSGRISEKKNLLYGIELLSAIKTARINFDIYGLIEDTDYWERCLKSVNSLPENITVSYRGTYTPDKVGDILQAHHLLFLPTLNENYGHSIVESLRSGCPVIISDQTPWKDLQQYGAGFALPLSDKSEFARAIERYAEMPEEEFQHCRERAIYYIEQKISRENTRELYKELFNA